MATSCSGTPAPIAAAQAAPVQAAQELGPDRFGLGTADFQTQNLAPPVGIDADGEDDRNRDDPSTAPDLEGGGVDPDRAFPGLEQRLIFIEAVRGRARRAVFGHHVQIIGQRIRPLFLVKLRHPVVVKPDPVIGGHQRPEERHVLAPARLAAQADAVLVLAFVGHRLGGGHDLGPGRRLRQLDAGGLGQIGAKAENEGLTWSGHDCSITKEKEARRPERFRRASNRAKRWSLKSIAASYGAA